MRIYEDLRDVQQRLGVAQRVVMSLILALLGVFWHMQIHRALHYQTLAEKNRERTVVIAAPRGRLMDRNGRVLVENRPSFNITVAPEHTRDLDDTVVRLARSLQTGEARLRERLAQEPSRYRAVVVKTDASLKDVAALDARRLELPNVHVQVVPLRSYPLATDAAHTLGRVGEVTTSQLASPELGSVRRGALIGQAGLEAEYNRRLMGVDGYRRVVVDSRGAEVDEAERIPPREGPSLTLTLDADLQRVAEQAMAGESGSVVALDPRTGEVLAIVSTPAYDPNQFTAGISADDWKELRKDPETPLMHRVIQGQYAPGSIFKIVVAAAALEEEVVTPGTTVFCSGSLAIYDTVFRCNRPGGHGSVDMRRAIQHSCNVYFYRVGVQLGIERIANWARRLGLGRATGIDLPHEMSGLIPDPDWKQSTRGLPWYAGETVSVAIGQGQVLTTPLQLARLAAVMANGGMLVTPHLVLGVGGEPVPGPVPEAVGLHPETLRVIREGMHAVVNDHGSGWRAHLAGVGVSGKTGSAQVVSRAGRPKTGEIPRHLRAHGWFVAFAPSDDPQIALSVLVEHGESGGRGAAPVARRILLRYFGNKRGAPNSALEADQTDVD